MRAATSTISTSSPSNNDNVDKGSCVVTFCADLLEEAELVASQLSKLHQSGISWHDMAILYRSNPNGILSRALEKPLLAHGIPYLVVRGSELLSKAVAKNALSALWLVRNPMDNMAFARVFGLIKGLARGSLDKFADWATARTGNEPNTKDTITIANDDSKRAPSSTTKSVAELRVAGVAKPDPPLVDALMAWRPHHTGTGTTAADLKAAKPVRGRGRGRGRARGTRGGRGRGKTSTAVAGPKTIQSKLTLGGPSPGSNTTATTSNRISRPLFSGKAKDGMLHLQSMISRWLALISSPSSVPLAVDSTTGSPSSKTRSSSNGVALPSSTITDINSPARLLQMIVEDLQLLKGDKVTDDDREAISLLIREADQTPDRVVVPHTAAELGLTQSDASSSPSKVGGATLSAIGGGASLSMMDRLAAFLERISFGEVLRGGRHLNHATVGEEKKKATSTNDCVTLSTIHAAKGLEWRVVFGVHMADGIFPRHKPDLDNPEEQPIMSAGDGSSNSTVTSPQEAFIQEERRVAYVLASRARHSLFFSVPKIPYRQGDSQPEATKESPFVREIIERCPSLVNVRLEVPAAVAERAELRRKQQNDDAAAKKRATAVAKQEDNGDELHNDDDGDTDIAAVKRSLMAATKSKQKQFTKSSTTSNSNNSNNSEQKKPYARSLSMISSQNDGGQSTLGSFFGGNVSRSTSTSKRPSSPFEHDFNSDHSTRNDGLLAFASASSALSAVKSTIPSSSTALSSRSTPIFIDRNDYDDNDDNDDVTDGKRRGGGKAAKRSFAGYDCVALGLPNASFAPASASVTMAKFRSTSIPSTGPRSIATTTSTTSVSTISTPPSTSTAVNGNRKRSRDAQPDHAFTNGHHDDMDAAIAHHIDEQHMHHFDDDGYETIEYSSSSHDPNTYEY
jgi:hypothetical protein